MARFYSQHKDLTQGYQPHFSSSAVKAVVKTEFKTSRYTITVGNIQWPVIATSLAYWDSDNVGPGRSRSSAGTMKGEGLLSQREYNCISILPLSP
jgi:hypothetical protein